MKTLKVLQELPKREQRQNVSKNAVGGLVTSLAQQRVVTSLQFVENAVSAEFCKVKET